MESGLTIAGKYRLGELLGAGGMASVWSATNIFTERKFAIKFMLPQVAHTPEAARRFLMEAKVSARVNHPNVIEIIDVGQTEDGTLFLVMELLTGMSLETAMKQKSPPMTLREFIFTMLEVARALSAAHKNGVIHRDLKPTNIFLHKDRDGTPVPKLLDFGVSKFLEDEGNNGLTVAGTVLGSPLYMSPEQARGDVIDARTDVFAFGGILFEGLAGVRAYEGTNFNQLIVAIATKQPKKIDEHAPRVPDSLRSIVVDCMVTDRNKRLATFDVIADRLKNALPQLDNRPLRAPAGKSGASPELGDDDVTNALHPSARTDRPAPLSASGVAGTQATSNTIIDRPERRGVRVFVAIALVAMLAGAAAFAAMRFRPREIGTSSPVPATAPVQSAASLPPSATAIAAASSDVPSISVDALPVASKSQAPTPGRGIGRLSVTATGGGCTVFVDGVSKGSTPLAALDLPAGTHLLRCDPPNGGKPKTATTVIQDGQSTRYKFNIDE